MKLNFFDDYSRLSQIIFDISILFHFHSFIIIHDNQDYPRLLLIVRYNFILTRSLLFMILRTIQDFHDYSRLLNSNAVMNIHDYSIQILWVFRIVRIIHRYSKSFNSNSFITIKGYSRPFMIIKGYSWLVNMIQFEFIYDY